MHEFFADVSILVTDTKGSPYLQLSGADSMSYAMLPAGKYRVTVRFHGQSETREVTLDGKSGSDVDFHWKGIRGCQVDMRRRSATRKCMA